MSDWSLLTSIRYWCVPTVRDLSVGDATFITASDTEGALPSTPTGPGPAEEQNVLRFSPTATTAITFAWGQGQIVLHQDGRMELTGYDSLDEAATAFWGAVQRWAPLEWQVILPWQQGSGTGSAGTREPVSPETLFYGFCFALNELHRHVHGLPQSAAKGAISDVVERLRELTQGLLPLVLAEERRQAQ